MIVNPSEFNYRLALGSLIIAIIALAAFGFANYRDIKSDTDFIKQEKKLLRQELSAFISQYDALELENDSIRLQYDTVLDRAQSALDSLNHIKADVALLSHVQSELLFLKRQSKTLGIDSLNLLIADLENKRSEISNELTRQTKLSQQLRSENRFLNKLLESGTKIYANSFHAKVFRENSNGQLVLTDRANKADQIEVCFVLGENPLVNPGNKQLFIQIVGPDNNVINDMGAIEFGDLSLIYSAKISVNYANKNTEVCTAIPGSDEFEKGLYFVSVFENERRLGGTQLELN